ncbi:hypothetical protein [Chryseobacterium sp. IT-36CA2]|uniref:hypothetical protein n=1 Tax=Chryseobacterium sp. IT-36CA2 TaxID=3026460 RepID=UPI0039DFB248
MKKKIISLFLLSTVIWVSAQVGVNTSSPATTLDVVGKPTVTSTLDGIIPPRITGAQLRAKNYTAAQTGAVVYVTAADTAPALQTVNVTSTGLFSFDGSVWRVVSTPPPSSPVGTGTVIYVNGQQQIAQEISAKLSNDWKVPFNNSNPAASTNKQAIGNLTDEYIDNFNAFTGTDGTVTAPDTYSIGGSNSFTVNASGTYLVNMNFPLQCSSGGPLSGNFYYGVYNITDNKWEAYSLDTINNLSVGQLKNIAYLAGIDLLSGKNYSLYVAFQSSNTGILLMRGVNTISGSPSPMTFFSVKRLK